MKSTNELPDDHLKMPPPYWRSSSAIFQVIEALEDLLTIFPRLIIIHAEIEEKVKEYFIQNPEETGDNFELSIIVDPLWDIEHKAKLKCELAIFMTSIHLEDLLNQVIVYNLDKDFSEVIEKLSPPEKLQLLAINLSKKSIKSKKPYESLKKITTWRNAYAHGHCTDRPTKSLRHNHLITPDEYSTFPKEIEFLISGLKDYFIIVNYLKSISINKYTTHPSVEDDQIKNTLNQLERYKFKYEGNGETYEIKLLSS